MQMAFPRRLSENALSESTLTCPNSSELPKNNARNIRCMAVLIFLKFLDFEQNPYSRTSSWCAISVILVHHNVCVKQLQYWLVSVRKKLLLIRHCQRFSRWLIPRLFLEGSYV